MRQRVCRRRARDADRAECQVVRLVDTRLAGLRDGDGHAVRLGEGEKIGGRVRVEHAAARDDHRPLRPADQRDGARELVLVRARPALRPHARLEQTLGKVVGLGLHVLADRQRHRPAVHRVGQHLHGAAEGRNQLLGPLDAVEVARHGPEAVGSGDCAVPPVLDLLQHRVRQPVGEHVAGQEQDRQPVDVRDARRRDEVQGARPDRRGAGHEAAPEAGLGEGDRRVRHALLGVGAKGRELVLHAVERLADAGDVAVAEDRPAAGEDRQRPAGHHRLLRRHEAHQGLRGRQAHRRTRHRFRSLQSVRGRPPCPGRPADRRRQA